jgi:hypothetical protein
MEVRPISRNEALRWLAEHHRHLKRPITGWLFGVEILDGEGKRVGVACAGRPMARHLQDGLTVEITRVCTDGTRNACSAAYGALRRAAVALGYRRIITYTRADEPGTACKAAGFRDDGLAGGGEASRPSRPRQASEDPSPKRRWIWTATPRTAA